MDKITFFQQTLQTLGEREYKRDTPSGNACDLWFPSVMHETLNYGAWSFAVKSIDLTAEKDRTYILPEDCLRPLKIDALRYRIDGRRIIIEQSWYSRGDKNIYIRYISNALAKAETLPETQPLFVRGTSLLLAARIATKITGEPQLALNLEQMAAATLADALHKDALSQYSNDQHPLSDILQSSIIS